MCGWVSRSGKRRVALRRRPPSHPRRGWIPVLRTTPRTPSPVSTCTASDGSSPTADPAPTPVHPDWIPTSATPASAKACRSSSGNGAGANPKVRERTPAAKIGSSTPSSLRLPDNHLGNTLLEGTPIVVSPPRVVLLGPTTVDCDEGPETRPPRETELSTVPRSWWRVPTLAASVLPST